MSTRSTGKAFVPLVGFVVDGCKQQMKIGPEKKQFRFSYFSVSFFFPPTFVCCLPGGTTVPFSADGQLRKEKFPAAGRLSAAIFSALTLTPTGVQRTRCSCLSTKLTTDDRVASASLVRSSMTNFSSMDYITST